MGHIHTGAFSCLPLASGCFQGTSAEPARESSRTRALIRSRLRAVDKIPFLLSPEDSERSLVMGYFAGAEYDLV